MLLVVRMRKCVGKGSNIIDIIILIFLLLIFRSTLCLFDFVGNAVLDPLRDNRSAEIIMCGRMDNIK